MRPSGALLGGGRSGGDENEGLGFRVEVSFFICPGLGFRVQGLGRTVQGLGTLLCNPRPKR